MNKSATIFELQERFRQVGQMLNELQRRQWAAAEAQKLGRGGITIVSLALHMSRNTIRRGIQEISSAGSGSGELPSPRIRRPGGGRKSPSAKKLPQNSSSQPPVNMASKVRLESHRDPDEQVGQVPLPDQDSVPASDPSRAHHTNPLSITREQS